MIQFEIDAWNFAKNANLTKLKINSNKEDSLKRNLKKYNYICWKKKKILERVVSSLLELKKL